MASPFYSLCLFSTSKSIFGFGYLCLVLIYCISNWIAHVMFSCFKDYMCTLMIDIVIVNLMDLSHAFMVDFGIFLLGICKVLRLHTVLSGGL